MAAMEVSERLRKAKHTLDRVFDKSLLDLVRGIRNHKDDESNYIMQCVEEIKSELKINEMSVKANAINKLVYIQMLGYDISWAAFNIIEVMSSSKFIYKRIGYMAASQTFRSDTDVLLLTTNQLKKDICSRNIYDCSVALSGVSCFMDENIAHDLLNDLTTLMSSSKAYLRKKAVLTMYGVFLRYPEALKTTFGRLKERLDDTDQGVQAATVHVICELARKNPNNYLPLAPTFFRLMGTSSNNWMLIKIIKLFGVLTPLEPRLGKKLIEPLTSIIQSTSAMSLLYECVNTVIAVLLSLSNDLASPEPAIQLCVQKLLVLVQDSDQNLKYLGLLALSRIMKSYPQSLSSRRSIIIKCLQDNDESIRLRALDIFADLVDQIGLMEITKCLMLNVYSKATPFFRHEIIVKIINLCSANNYKNVKNFEWYISIILELIELDSGTIPSSFIDQVSSDLTKMSNISQFGSRHYSHSDLFADQLLNVCVRVQSVRQFAVQQMALLLLNMHLIVDIDPNSTDTNSDHDDQQHQQQQKINRSPSNSSSLFSMKVKTGMSTQRQSSCKEILSAAAWICGEYCQYLIDGVSVLESLMRIRNLSLSDKAIYISIHSTLKILGYLINEECQSVKLSFDEKLKLLRDVQHFFQSYEQHDHLQIQERAYTYDKIIQVLLKRWTKLIDNDSSPNQTVTSSIINDNSNGIENEENSKKINNIDEMLQELLNELKYLFESPLNPVASKAQKKVPIPNGIDLDEWIDEPLKETMEKEISIDDYFVEAKNDFLDANLTGQTSFFGHKPSSSNTVMQEMEKEKIHISPEELERRKQMRQLVIENNPFYIKSPPTKKTNEKRSIISNNSIERTSSIEPKPSSIQTSIASMKKEETATSSIFLSSIIGGSGGGGVGGENVNSSQLNTNGDQQHTLMSSIGITSSDVYLRSERIDRENEFIQKKLSEKKRKKKKEKSKKKSSNEEKQESISAIINEENVPSTPVIAEEEMPEGFDLEKNINEINNDSDSDEINRHGKYNPHRALAKIDLSEFNKKESEKEIDRTPTSTFVNNDNGMKKKKKKKKKKNEKKKNLNLLIEDNNNEEKKRQDYLILTSPSNHSNCRSRGEIDEKKDELIDEKKEMTDNPIQEWINHIDQNDDIIDMSQMPRSISDVMNGMNEEEKLKKKTKKKKKKLNEEKKKKKKKKCEKMEETIKEEEMDLNVTSSPLHIIPLTREEMIEQFRTILEELRRLEENETIQLLFDVQSTSDVVIEGKCGNVKGTKYGLKIHLHWQRKELLLNRFHLELDSTFRIYAIRRQLSNLDSSPYQLMTEQFNYESLQLNDNCTIDILLKCSSLEYLRKQSINFIISYCLELDVTKSIQIESSIIFFPSMYIDQSKFIDNETFNERVVGNELEYSTTIQLQSERFNENFFFSLFTQHFFHQLLQLTIMSNEDNSYSFYGCTLFDEQIFVYAKLKNQSVETVILSTCNVYGNDFVEEIHERSPLFLKHATTTH